MMIFYMAQEDWEKALAFGEEALAICDNAQSLLGAVNTIRKEIGQKI